MEVHFHPSKKFLCQYLICKVECYFFIASCKYASCSLPEFIKAQTIYNDAMNENDKSMETIVKMANTAIKESR